MPDRDRVSFRAIARSGLKRFWPLLALALFFAWAVTYEISTAQNQRQQTAANNQGNQKPEDDNASVFVVAGHFANIHHDAIEAVSALVSAFFAIVLTASTVGLWIVTRSAASATKAAADAAKQSADTADKALTQLERPFVFVDVPETGLSHGIVTPADGPALATRINFKTMEISFENLGRTPALLKRVEFKIDPAPHGSIAAPIDPTQIGGRALPVGIISQGHRIHRERENLFPRFLGGSVGEDAANGKVSIWLIGFVRYADIFDNCYISGFAMVYDQIGKRFMMRGGDKYNYARTEKPEEIPEPSSTG